MRRFALLGIVSLLTACLSDYTWTPSDVDTPDPDDGTPDDGTPDDDPPSRPTDDDPDEDPTNPDDDPGDDPVLPELVAPGGRCDCDSDCEAVQGYDPLCIHGICGVHSTDDRCAAGSSSPCPADHRCWSGTGHGVCYPDYIPDQCDGTRDSDGSCVTDGSHDCYRACGDLCNMSGEPPGGIDDDDPVPPEDDPCDGLTYVGECAGNTARWCENDEIREQDCSARGQICVYIDETSGHYCRDDDGGDPPSGAGGTCDNATVIEQIRLTNEARSRNGLPELTCDNGLTRAAYLHAQDMCTSGYFSHTSRDGSSVWDRIRAQGVTFGTAGENIAWGQSSASEVHTTWMNSWGHRANILNRSYRRIGVGYEPCGGRPHWVQNFSD